jgi:hypothetical protein
MNSAADAATAAEGARQKTRDLSSALASADQSRINSEAGYNQQALGATAVPISADAGLYGTSTGAANTAETNATNAAKVPGFWDTLGSSFANAFGAAKGGAGGQG